MQKAWSCCCCCCCFFIWFFMNINLLKAFSSVAENVSPFLKAVLWGHHLLWKQTINRNTWVSFSPEKECHFFLSWYRSTVILECDFPPVFPPSWYRPTGDIWMCLLATSPHSTPLLATSPSPYLFKGEKEAEVLEKGIDIREKKVAEGGEKLAENNYNQSNITRRCVSV